MEALERCAIDFPEFQPLCDTMREFSQKLKACSDAPCSYPTEKVEENVFQDTNKVQELVDKLSSESEDLKFSLTPAPLCSLEALCVQFRSEMKRSPNLSNAIKGEALCEQLNEMLDSIGAVGCSEENQHYEAVIQEYLKSPLDQIYEHEVHVSSQLERSLSVESGLVNKIKTISDQVAAPGFRPNRVELMDSRSVLVQQLLSAVSARHQTVGDCSPITEILESKLQGFEELHSRRIQAISERVILHQAIEDLIARHRSDLEKLVLGKQEALQTERKNVEQRALSRVEKVGRISDILKEAMDSVCNIIEECHQDAVNLSKSALEAKLLQKYAEELETSLGTLASTYQSANQSWTRGSELETAFASWLRQAYSGMKECSLAHIKNARKLLPRDRARMEILSGAAVKQVQCQRELVSQAFERTSKEIQECQDTLRSLEFSNPSSRNFAEQVNSLEQLEEALKWQRQEVDALVIVEQKMLSDTADFAEVAGSFQNNTPDEEWEQLLHNAEDWVHDFFFTWEPGSSKALPALTCDYLDATRKALAAGSAAPCTAPSIRLNSSESAALSTLSAPLSSVAEDQPLPSEVSGLDSSGACNRSLEPPISPSKKKFLMISPGRSALEFLSTSEVVVTPPPAVVTCAAPQHATAPQVPATAALGSARRSSPNRAPATITAVSPDTGLSKGALGYHSLGPTPGTAVRGTSPNPPQGYSSPRHPSRQGLATAQQFKSDGYGSTLGPPSRRSLGPTCNQILTSLTGACVPQGGLASATNGPSITTRLQPTRGAWQQQGMPQGMTQGQRGFPQQIGAAPAVTGSVGGSCVRSRSSGALQRCQPSATQNSMVNQATPPQSGKVSGLSPLCGGNSHPTLQKW